jgi:hypothetical protein
LCRPSKIWLLVIRDLEIITHHPTPHGPIYLWPATSCHYACEAGALRAEETLAALKADERSICSDFNATKYPQLARSQLLRPSNDPFSHITSQWLPPFARGRCSWLFRPGRPSPTLLLQHAVSWQTWSRHGNMQPVGDESTLASAILLHTSRRTNRSRKRHRPS